MILLSFLLFAAAAPAGCAGSPTSQTAESFDYAALIENLERSGLPLEERGEVEQDFFSVKGRVIGVDAEDVQVFEYPSASAARSDAARVSPDGTTIGTSKITWLGPPHFYRRDQVIAIYIGNKASVKQILESVLGSQFAGQ